MRSLTGGSIWIDVSSPALDTWWSVEIRSPNQILVCAHYPNDPDDVPFGPPDDWFATARAAALYLKASASVRATNRQALGPYVLTALKDSRERAYTFETAEEATEFAAELIKQGVPSSEMAFYQREPLPRAALSA